MSSMKRLYIITLTFIILLSQLGVIEHTYHKHTPDETCEYCLSAQPLDSAVLTADFIFPFTHPFSLTSQSTLILFTQPHFNHYSARAPPHII